MSTKRTNLCECIFLSHLHFYPYSATHSWPLCIFIYIYVTLSMHSYIKFIWRIYLKKIVYLKKIYKFTLEHFLIWHVVFVLIVKNFLENKKFYFILNVCEIQKNVGKDNCSLEKDLQIGSWLFFHESYIFSFVHRKRFYKNQKFNFPAKIYEIWKKC